MSIASDRINKLATLNRAHTYLEIGVANGSTFHEVMINHKTAVDPEFLFDVSQYVNQPGQYYYNKKSNDFFHEVEREIAESSREGGFTWDIVYIDGLHTYEQAMNDFINSLSYANDRTIWIFDDTVPSDPWAAIPNQSLCYYFRELAGITGADWQGDVFKCIFDIHDFFQDFSYTTVIGNGNPQTIVWKMDKRCQRPRIFRDRIEIENMDYFTMLQRCAALYPLPEDKMFSVIGTEVNIPLRNSGHYIPLLVNPLHSMSEYQYLQILAGKADPDNA